MYMYNPVQPYGIREAWSMRIDWGNRGVADKYGLYGYR